MTNSLCKGAPQGWAVLVNFFANGFPLYDSNHELLFLYVSPSGFSHTKQVPV